MNRIASSSRVLAWRLQKLVNEYLVRKVGCNAILDPSLPNNASASYPGNDGGKDFIVNVPSEGTELFGVRLHPGDRCLVEVKSASSSSVAYQAVAPNLSRLQVVAAEHVLVVTNAHFAPSTQVDLYENFSSLKDRLHLIEGRALKHWCDLENIAWPSEVVPSVPFGEKEHKGLAIEANSLAVREVGGQAHMFPMAFRNLTDQKKTVEVYPASDVEWWFTERNPLDEELSEICPSSIDDYVQPRKTLIVPPWQSRAVRLSGYYLTRGAHSGLSRRPIRGRRGNGDGARIVAEVDGQPLPFTRIIPQSASASSLPSLVSKIIR